MSDSTPEEILKVNLQRTPRRKKNQAKRMQHFLQDGEAIPNVRLYFDGLCEPRNPGGVATYGFAIYRGSEKIAEGKGCASEPGPHSTTNVAEYMGLIRGLERAVEMGVTEEIYIQGDSQLVLNQIRGWWRVRAKHLKPLRKRVKELLAQFPNWKAKWMPRKYNVEADTLSREAYEEYCLAHDLQILYGDYKKMQQSR